MFTKNRNTGCVSHKKLIPPGANLDKDSLFLDFHQIGKN